MPELYPTYLDSDVATILNPANKDYDGSVASEAVRMNHLAQAVPYIGLPQLAPGFLMYSEATLSVYKNRNLFEYWDKIKETVPKFGQLAYDPLLSVINGRPYDMHELWSDLYEPDEDELLTDIGVLRRFWKAHVCIDLPEVAAKTLTQRKHKSDFFLVNPLLAEAGVNVRRNLSIPRGIGDVGFRFMMQDVFVDRRFAWRDGQRLLRAEKLPTTEQVDARRNDIFGAATRRARITYALSQPAIDNTLRLVTDQPADTWRKAS